MTKSRFRRVSVVRAAIVLVITVSLGGCGGLGSHDDQDVVVRAEPRSKYGNPSSYVVFGKRYHVLNSSQGFVERGIASWYGKKFHGRRTSSGELYDMHGMTAAHKNLPLPTFVKVTNLENERSVILRVNDRGPFHDNRVIDLSYTAAKKLGIVRKGTGYVEVRALQPDSSPEERPAVESVASQSRATKSTPPSSFAPSGAGNAATAIDGTSGGSGTGSGSRSVASAEKDSKAVELYLQVGAFSEPGNAKRLRERLKETVDGESKLSRIDSISRGGQTLYRVRLGPLEGVSHADRLTESLLAMGLDSPRVVLE